MPRWSHDGRQLYYMSPEGKLMAAAVHADKTFSADGPQPLFSTRVRTLPGITRNQYDVMPDGRFLMNLGLPGSEKQSPITLVQNWTRKLPAQ